MKSKNKIIALSEFGEISLSELEGKIGKRGIRLLQRININHGVDIFRLLFDRIKATQFVGFVKVLGYTIQVVPKIFENNEQNNLHFLLQLLKYTKKIKIKEHELGNLSKLKDDFFEIIIYLFAKNLRDLLRKDFKKTYVEYEENVFFLKGKLLIGEQIKRNAVNDSRFCCRFEEFTENNIMNQLFKHVALLLMRVSRSVSNKKILEDILIYLCDVESVVISSSDINKIHFSRLNCEYEPLVNLCRLILENMSVEFASAKLETFVFMFDMNMLFEEFVFDFTKKYRSSLFVDGEPIKSIKDQFYLGRFFNEFRMKVDIAIGLESGKTILLDTKYKMLDDSRSHKKISQSDFYQMFAYSNSQKQRYSDIILLYPEPESGSKVKNRSFLHDVEGEDLSRIHVRTVKLSDIFDDEKKRIDVQKMIMALNDAFKIGCASEIAGLLN